MQHEVTPAGTLRAPVYQFEGTAEAWSDWHKTVTLLKHLTRRHLAARYRGSSLGFVWSLLNPVLLMVVYTFVFSVVFRTTVPGVPYAVFFLNGMLAWNFFSIAAMNAAVSLVDGAPLIKKAPFPHMVLPVSAVLSNAVNYVATLPLLILFNLLFGVVPTWSILLLPTMVLLLVLLATGVGLLLAVLMPFFRDLQHLIEALFTIWLFLTPVLYPMQMVRQNLPAGLVPLYELNPMVGTVHFVRAVLLGQPLPWASVAIATGGALCLLGLGWRIFQRFSVHTTEL